MDEVLVDRACRVCGNTLADWENPECCAACSSAAYEKTKAQWRARGWHKETCSQCGATGMVAHYSASDFEGAIECSACWGTGGYWVSPKGRMAICPGGPFLGRL